MRPAIIACFLVGAFTIPVRADEPSKPPEKAIKVPITVMPTGHFLVEVKLNGKGPYKLIFDTGAPTMLINNRIAKDSGVLDPKAPKPLFAPFGAAGPSKIKNMQIGDVKVDDVPAMVMDHPTVEVFSNHFKKEHGAIEGIVGFPFFARFKMTVDYQAKELTFVPTNYQPEDLMQSLTKTLMSRPADADKPKVLAPKAQWGMALSKNADDEEAGVTIKTVMSGSAAEKAGLKAGDRLLTLDGRWTDTIGDAYHAASFVKPGKTVTIVVKRDGKEVKLMVTPLNGL